MNIIPMPVVLVSATVVLLVHAALLIGFAVIVLRKPSKGKRSAKLSDVDLLDMPIPEEMVRFIHGSQKMTPIPEDMVRLVCGSHKMTVRDLINSLRAYQDATLWSGEKMAKKIEVYCHSLVAAFNAQRIIREVINDEVRQGSEDAVST